MGKSPNTKNNQVRREMLERYGREVHEVNTDWNERRAQKHKRSWETQDLEEDEEEDSYEPLKITVA